MKRRHGFSLIEVSLVIAISSLLFIAFIASVAGVLAARRYNDSVQSFADFLQTQYSRAINIESAGTGTSRQAIYGRLITFGENGSTIYAYDIIGAAVEVDTIPASTSIISALFEAPISATVLREEDFSCATINQEVYNITNGAWAETIMKDDPFIGSIFIIRSPISNMITTLYSPSVVRAQDALATVCSEEKITHILDAAASELTASEDINFCVASDDLSERARRRNIRISVPGSNSSAVQILPQDTGDNLCD